MPTTKPSTDPEPDKNPENETLVYEGEGTSDWMMSMEAPDEYAMAAAISEVEALEPCSLDEARKRPDWLLWEQAIQEELKTLLTAKI